MVFFLFDRSAEKEARGMNPYRTRVHRFACCTWCLGFGYAFLAFLVGGALVAAVVPLSGACLVLDDMSSEMLFDVVPGLSWNNTGDAAVMTKELIEQCVNPSDVSQAVNANMLDILFQRDNGTKVTMREKFVEQMKDQITSKFDLIEEKLSGVSSTNLAGNPTVTRLRLLLRDTPMDAMILADSETMLDMDDYKPLLMDPRGEDGVSVALASSAACEELTLATNDAYGDLAGRSVPGIHTLVSKLEGLGVAIPDTSCAQKVACDVDLSAVGQAKLAACEAANKVVDLKRQLLSSNSYRCDMFESSDGQVCDPTNMIHRDGEWQNDCLYDDGSMNVKHIKCSLEEFTEYVKSFDDRMLKVFLRLDQTVGEVKDEINAQLRDLVDDHITQPIDRLANGVTCGFVASHYRALVDGFCYQGVYGLRVIGWCYVACGILALLLIVVIHTVWRRAVDNVKFWEPTVNGKQANADKDPSVPSSIQALPNSI